MRKIVLAGLAAVCAAALVAEDKVQPLDVKLGLWETTVVGESSGAPPIPPEMLAKMTPEQRARMEAAFKQQQAEGAKTHTMQKCMTKEDLTRTTFMGKDDPQCTKTIITSTSRKLEGKVECTHGGGKQSGTFTVEATDSTNVKGDVHMVLSAGANTMTANSHFTGKWIGPQCGTVK